MAIVLTGTKTVTRAVAPHLTAAGLTALLATALENLTVAQLKELVDAVERVPGGSKPGATLGSLFG
jgi:hypothetical protein